MNLSIYSVLRVVGLVFLVVSMTMIPSLIVAGIYQEIPALLTFLGCIVFGALFGYLLLRKGKALIGKLKIRDGFLIVSICWVISTAFGAAPFAISGSIPNWIDAFFESVSGFTTTGCTLLTDIEALPKSMLFWRSFTHWIGGMGILLFAIALMPSLGINGQNIAISETPGPSLDKITPKMSDTAKDLYLIYLCVTALETLLLWGGGMSLYDALINTFGCVGTGGFSNYNDSIAHYDSAYVAIVMSVFMILCSLNFNLYYLSLRRGPNTLLKDSEFRFFIIIVFAAILLIMLNLRLSNTNDTWGGAMLDASFQTASIVSTSGFSTTDFNLWPTFSKMILLLLMFVGGCASSTGGGLKAVRVLIMLRFIARGIATRLHPNAVVTVKLNNRTVPADAVSAIANHCFLYTAVIFVSTILLAIDGYDLITNFSAVLTCIGNVGPGLEAVGPMGNFSIFSPGGKMLLSLLMLAGRLELFTLLVLLMPRFWNPDH